MDFQYSLYGMVLLVSAVVLSFLAVYSYQKRSSKLHIIFSGLILSVVVWSFGSAMEFFSIGVGLKIFWIQISYIGVTTAAPLWFMLVLSYGQYNNYLKPKYILSLMILPLVILFLAFTNSWHGLVWSSIIPSSSAPGALLIYEHALFFWINIIYSFAMILMGIILLFHILNSSSKIYRIQIYILLLSGFIPLIFSLMYTTRIINISGLDITPFGLIIAGFLIAIDIFKFDFLDIRPIANEILFESIKNAFLVFDKDDTLIEVNSSASIIGIGPESIGKQADEIFEDLSDFKSFYHGTQLEEEIFLKEPLNLWVQLQIHPIYTTDDVKEFLGKLLIIQNITHRKMVENQLSDSEERYKVLTDLSPDAIVVVVDTRIVFANKATAKLFGAKDPQDIVGKEMVDFIHPEFKDISRNRLYQVYVERKSLDFLEEKMVSLNNEIKDIEIGDVPITYNDEHAVQVVIRDITERKKLEMNLKKSLDEKDLMMKEIHHRVKNNLMVIQSLLNMQSRYITDPAVLNVFKESQNRAKSMALIHQRLYQSTDLKRIEFGEYVKALTTDLFHSYVTDPGKIKLNISVEKVMLDINTSIPLGLILNELISNSLKYAFPGDKKGELSVEFISKVPSKGSEYELIVSDDGIGLPDDFDYEKSDSLGFRLIYGLSEQIDAKIKVDRDNGTKFEIIFEEQPVIPE